MSMLLGGGSSCLANLLRGCFPSGKLPPTVFLITDHPAPKYADAFLVVTLPLNRGREVSLSARQFPSSHARSSVHFPRANLLFSSRRILIHIFYLPIPFFDSKMFTFVVISFVENSLQISKSSFHNPSSFACLNITNTV